MEFLVITEKNLLGNSSKQGTGVRMTGWIYLQKKNVLISLNWRISTRYNIVEVKESTYG